MADKEKLQQLKLERAQLQKEQQDILAEIENINEEIAGRKKTATYQKWKQLYERAVKEINREKKSSSMNMDKYQNMMREVRKMKKAYPLADVMQKKTGLEARLTDVSAKLNANRQKAKSAKVDKSPVKAEPVITENTSKVGAIEGLRQMAALQANISRVQATERIKKITDAIASLSMNVDAKINLAMMSYKKHRAIIESTKKEYETKVDEIVDRFRDNMIVLEEGKQLLETKEAECLSKLAVVNDEIKFRKQDEPYKKWLSDYKKNAAQIKRVKSAKHINVELYHKLLDEHTKLKAQNPLNKGMQDRENLTEELRTIREQIVESEGKKAEFYQEQLQAFAEATQERDNKLILSEKKGAFKRFIGGLADKINSKKRVETSVVAPLKQLTERLGKISENLAAKKEQYFEEIAPLMNGEKNIEPKSITEVIQHGKNKKEGIVASLKKLVKSGKEGREQQKDKDPIFNVQAIMEMEA